MNHEDLHACSVQTILRCIDIRNHIHVTHVTLCQSSNNGCCSHLPGGAYSRRVGYGDWKHPQMRSSLQSNTNEAARVIHQHFDFDVRQVDVKLCNVVHGLRSFCT